EKLFIKTSIPNASGYKSKLFKWRAIKTHRIPRPIVTITASVARYVRARSSVGPSTGATRANGVIVTSRYSATCGRADSAGTVKNREPASATATKASPARLAAYARARVVNGARDDTVAVNRRREADRSSPRGRSRAA